VRVIEIRDAQIDDAEAIVGLLNPIIALRSCTALDTLITIEEQRRFIRDFPSRGIFHVAVDSTTDHIVGFQDVSPFADYTHAFDHVGVIGTYVALDRHRQGIAAKLFAATFEVARRKGYEKIFTYVRADNDAGLRTYLGQGFRIVGTAERHAKIDGRYIDEIVIEKFLQDRKVMPDDSRIRAILL
jgi:L-amino acid N-acyltransferase YncA